MMTEQKKNLFDRAVDALTGRDEKAAKVVADKAAAEKAVALKAASDRATVTRVAAQKTRADRGAALRATVEKATASTAPTKGVVTIKSLRIRADHNTTSEVVAGLVDGNEVSILSTWSDGKNTWAKLDKGWAAMVHDGKTYIKLA
ncbi:MAG TPA: hypothetical protein VFG81_12215 [Anaerolineales bacterium]|nr:hypothetical protein [Anaerolineales bacterium]